MQARIQQLVVILINIRELNYSIDSVHQFHQSSLAVILMETQIPLHQIPHTFNLLVTATLLPKAGECFSSLFSSLPPCRILNLDSCGWNSDSLHSVVLTSASFPQQCRLILYIQALSAYHKPQKSCYCLRRFQRSSDSYTSLTCRSWSAKPSNSLWSAILLNWHPHKCARSIWRLPS